jgi:hypothetical protein
MRRLQGPLRKAINHVSLSPTETAEGTHEQKEQQVPLQVLYLIGTLQ